MDTTPTPTSSPDIAIRVQNVSKYYNMYDHPQDRLKEAMLPRLQRLVGQEPRHYARQFWALRDVSFLVERGETVGIVGRNGSGKSTLLQIVCGTLTPSSGAVQVQGRVAAMLELGSGFNPEFTGRENVYMNATVLGLSIEEIDARYDEIVAFAGIGEFIDQPVKTYSSGMTVRLAFAVSVSVQPDILVVDEALAVGDMAFQQQCLQRLSDLRDAGTTIVLVTHDIMLTRNYCSRVVYLDHGCVQAIGDPEAIGERYIKDVLSTQHAVTGSREGVAWKPEEGRLRFGTSKGRITGSAVRGVRGPGPVFTSGDTAVVELQAEVDRDIRNPELIVQLRDARGYVLYGLATDPTHLLRREAGDTVHISASLELDVHLGHGEYSISLGLVDRHGETVSTVLDKIVAALPLTVAPIPRSRAHGPVDLRARWLAPRDDR